ncbi:PAS domain S-box protein [Desulforamulus putei]|uniref:PAS domain S-box protein n=1 Tax=Desulforamulus putei TaxID=74701 RepID=UPI002FDD6603
MSFNQKLIKLALILFIIVCVCSVLLFQNFLTTYQQIGRIEDYQEQLTDFKELSSNIDAMTSSLQDYILLSDAQYLDRFHRYSAMIIKKQTDLYDSDNLPRNQNIHDLIELSKTYLSFASLEVIPTIQTKNYSQKEVQDFYLRNQDFTRQMNVKLRNLSETYNKELDNYFQSTLANINRKIILLLVLLFVSLLLLPYVLYLLLKPFLTKCLYTGELAEYTDSAFMFVDSSGDVKYVNKSARDLFGLLPEAVLDKNIEHFPELFPRLQNITQLLLHALLTQKELLRNRVNFNNDGRTIDLTVDYVPLFLLNKLVGVMMIARLANEQKDKSLLLDTLEKERKRISIEIHDWIARYMSTIIHSLDYNLRLHKNGHLKGDELLQNLRDLRNHCQNAAIEMRGIMNDIHPYLIDKVGLISALESYIQTYEKLNKIKVYIFYQDRALRVKKKDEIIIYRIIQEALSNIVKHAKATEVDINFTKQQDTLKIEIMDNGGAEGDFLVGKGLWGMKERAALIGGDIVFGYCETGFCVTLTVPIQPGGQEDGENQDHVD